MRGDHEKKSDGVRVHLEKERWRGMRVEHKKKSDRLRVYHEKERWDESSP